MEKSLEWQKSKRSKNSKSRTEQKLKLGTLELQKRSQAATLDHVKFRFRKSKAHLIPKPAKRKFPDENYREISKKLELWMEVFETQISQ